MREMAVYCYQSIVFHTQRLPYFLRKIGRQRTSCSTFDDKAQYLRRQACIVKGISWLRFESSSFDQRHYILAEIEPNHLFHIPQCFSSFI